MSTAGFEEAYNDAKIVRVKSDPNLDIYFASLSGLTIMKLISWNERYPERKKDAVDLEFIMKNYIYAGNEDRVFKEDSDLLKGKILDYELVSARLLGRDVAAISKPDTKLIIQGIVELETTKGDYKLVTDMIASKFHFSDNDDSFEESLSLLMEFKAGFSGL